MNREALENRCKPGLSSTIAPHLGNNCGAAVDYFADASFSTGRVGMIGKSYDGWTGLMGMAQDPAGLAAVVSMEPVYSGYRYMFNNGVPRGNEGALGTMNNFQRYDAQPGALNDDPEYLVNGLPGAMQPLCYAENLTEAEDNDGTTAYWTARDLLPLTAGSDIPLFLTQGFLETNTEPDAAFAFWSGLDDSAGANRAWFGQFDHVRGWDRDNASPLDKSARPSAGREGFEDAVMAFLDEHLKDIPADGDLPVVAVQDSQGAYRAEASWPPADALRLQTPLPPATFADTANNGDGSGSGNGAWTVSQVLPSRVRLAGEPRVTGTVTTTAADVDIAANVYDIDEDGGIATLVSRATVLLSGGNRDWWSNGSTGSLVAVADTQIDLPLLAASRTAFLDGDVTARLTRHLANGTIPIGAVDLDATTTFTLPD